MSRWYLSAQEKAELEERRLEIEDARMQATEEVRDGKVYRVLRLPDDYGSAVLRTFKPSIQFHRSPGQVARQDTFRRVA